jgi:hypothetical protein
MRVSLHVATSAAIAAGLYAATRSPQLAAGCFVAGFLIDIDHLVDYVVEHGARPDPAHFFGTFREDLYRKARLPFHGWEWVAVWVALSWANAWDPMFMGLAAGWLQHLLFDQVSNHAAPGGYSLAYRALTGFSYRRSFPGRRAREARAGRSGVDDTARTL